MSNLASTKMAAYYAREMSKRPVEHWNTLGCIADCRRIAKALKRHASQIVYGDATCHTTAGELADSLERRAHRLEMYGE